MAPYHVGFNKSKWRRAKNRTIQPIVFSNRAHRILYDTERLCTALLIGFLRLVNCFRELLSYVET